MQSITNLGVGVLPKQNAATKIGAKPLASRFGGAVGRIILSLIGLAVLAWFNRKASKAKN